MKISRLLNVIRITILCLILNCNISSSYQLPDYIPDQLKPWAGWVLHEKRESIECIPHFNDSQAVQCAFPTSITLNLNHKGGEFVQEWQIYHESYVHLPGNNSNWIDDVVVEQNITENTDLNIAADRADGVVTDRADGVVTDRADKSVVIQRQDAYGNTIPTLKLSKGQYTIKGSFIWNRVPEYIQIPPESGFVKLIIDNKEVQFPNLDEMGRLWLKSENTAVEAKEENRLKIESFRLIDDNIPPQITLYAALDIAGVAREVKLGPIYPPKEFIPMALNSQLPSKLESDGTIRIQLKPGTYNLTLTLRHIGQLETLTFEPPDDGYWSKQEIWSVVRHQDLRVVEISGVNAIDPQRTSLPDEWKIYPAYIMGSKEIMKFKEIKRGDPVPPPDQLSLNRVLWLSFDGKGYTVQDTITGNQNSGWRLEFDPLMLPGKVAVDGVEQLITTLDFSNSSEVKPLKEISNRQSKDNSNIGVELRQGNLSLVAESKIEGSIYKIPATGWNHSFQRVAGTLNLPAGWRLISSKGIDNIAGTWIKSWSLLDIFIVLIFTIASAKLFSIPLSVIGFITMVLLYHETLAPRYVWIFLILGFVFLDLTAETSGRLRKAVKFYQFITVIILIIISISYAIASLRIGIYPQLERRWVSMNDGIKDQNLSNLSAVGGVNSNVNNLTQQLPASPEVETDSYKALEEQKTQYSNRTKTKGSLMDMPRKAEVPLEYLTKVVQYDPKSLTQTGPGLPLWYPFKSVNFSWSGPVESGQTISFILIGPKINLVLAFLRIFLIILLAVGMFKGGYGFGKSQDAYGFGKFKIGSIFKKPSILMVILISCIIFIPYKADAYEIPSQEMLTELQNRLVEKDRCFPNCADISHIDISISTELELNITVNAAVDTVIPLPGHSRHWLAEQAVIDGVKSEALFRIDQILWIMIPMGKHKVVILGKIGNPNNLQIPLHIKPHSGKIINSDGWEIQGVQPDGTLDDQLQFKRLFIKKDGEEKEPKQEEEVLETGLLPSFALVQRTLLLGLDWKVETTVKRLTPTGSAIMIKLPLLSGESVITEGVRVKNGVVEISLNSEQSSLTFESFLETSDSIRLYHDKNFEWTEVWRLDASPIFHVETKGIPVILHQNNQRWFPTWHPLPGEEVLLKISRPKGIDGQTMTIEKSYLELRPGRRTTQSILNISIKSSQGGQHEITIPEKAELQEVKINGTVQLIRQEGQKVVLPITPGVQNIELIWKDQNGIKALYKTPKVDLGISSVNSAVDLSISSDRWTLFVGGEQLMGPAVLFWSKIIVVLIASIGLTITGLTPLKFYQWFLLGIGMSMSNVVGSLFVAGWLIVLDMRRKWAGMSQTMTPTKFNFMQMGIVLLTFFSIMLILAAISQGLIGHPSMNITGNGSSENFLRWYQDISDAALPAGWVFSLPMFCYRVAMLLWALWLSFWLISILKWGWNNFSEPVLWVSSTKKRDIAGEDINTDTKIE